MAPNGGLVIQGYFLPGGPRVLPRPAPVPVPPPVPRVAQPHGAGPRAGAFPRAPQPPVRPAIQPPRNGSATQLPAGAAVLGSSPGQRLPPVVQQKMEAFFNASFADVRVHVGPEAASIGALAFTSGPHLYFAPGQYDPSAPHGQKLLAHELTHVVQQRAGRVRNPFGSGVALVQDLCLEAEAERMANRLAMQPKPAQTRPVQAKLAPPVHGGGGRAARVPVPRVPGQGATIQPGCLDGIGTFFRWLFSCGSSQSSSVDRSSSLELPTFDLEYGPKEIRDKIEKQMLLKEDDDWLEDTTCSTSSHRVFESLGQSKELSKGTGSKSLRTFMQGEGSRAKGGVVIEVKLGPLNLSLHEFTLEQVGDKCYLIQAWLHKVTLEEGLNNATRRNVSDVLDELEIIEKAFTSKDYPTLRGALKTTFKVIFTEEEWRKERMSWAFSAQLSWVARARK